VRRLEGVHVRRVNGKRRLRRCLAADVDSGDGAGYARFPNVMLPYLFAELDQSMLDFSS